MLYTDNNILYQLRMSARRNGFNKVSSDEQGYFRHLLASLSKARSSIGQPGGTDDIIFNTLHGVIPIELTSHENFEDIKAKVRELKWELTHPLDFAKSMIFKNASLLDRLRGI